MKSSNYRWATAEMRERYPSWVGIDHLVADALAAHIPAGGAVLEVGCGRRSPVGGFGTRAALTVGTDIDREDIAHNRDLKALVVSDGASLPFAAGTFDLVFSKTAIEHMRRPEEFFAGVSRALKPGGIFVWATSNVRSLPVLASRLTPLGIHRLVYRRLFGGAAAPEVFPTYYRANTPRAIERQLAAAGLERIALHQVSWPYYFAFSRPLFRAMLPVHRWTDRAGLHWLHVHLVGIHRKRDRHAT